MAVNDNPASVKLLPRNAAALRRGQSAASSPASGNPVSVRLESGVGNCFPGLEMDLRNLERRFFPFLEVDLVETEEVTEIRVMAVDIAGVRESAVRLPAPVTAAYEKISATLKVRDNGISNWTVTGIDGDFGPLGVLSGVAVSELSPRSSGPGRLPSDPWTAVRLLREGSEVTLRLRGPSGSRTVLSGKRATYLDDGGAFAGMFLPGEMTQSLCSPWTHDFRDCSCYYWASNHPDIAQPLSPSVGATDPAWNVRADWERALRSQGQPPPSATRDGAPGRQLAHYEINNRWQELHFVVNGRERTDPVGKETPEGVPYASDAELLSHLRYTAGVELAVMQEYLTAAYSLRRFPDAVASPAADATRASRAELLRIAIGEMRHLRVVNETLAALEGAAYAPALGIAAAIPILAAPGTRPRSPRPLSMQSLADFIEVESAAHAIDHLYANVIATLVRRGDSNLAQGIASIISDGQDHLETFLFIREWLAPHWPEAVAAPPPAPAPAGNADHAALQSAYLALLQGLFRGYQAGLPAGAGAINSARQGMVQPGGLNDLAERLAGSGFLVTFDVPSDPRFAPVQAP